MSADGLQVVRNVISLMRHAEPENASTYTAMMDCLSAIPGVRPQFLGPPGAQNAELMEKKILEFTRDVLGFTDIPMEVVRRMAPYLTDEDTNALRDTARPFRNAIEARPRRDFDPVFDNLAAENRSHPFHKALLAICEFKTVILQHDRRYGGMAFLHCRFGLHPDVQSGIPVSTTLFDWGPDILMTSLHFTDGLSWMETIDKHLRSLRNKVSFQEDRDQSLRLTIVFVTREIRPFQMLNHQPKKTQVVDLVGGRIGRVGTWAYKEGPGVGAQQQWCSVWQLKSFDRAIPAWLDSDDLW